MGRSVVTGTFALVHSVAHNVPSEPFSDHSSLLQHQAFHDQDLGSSKPPEDFHGWCPQSSSCSAQALNVDVGCAANQCALSKGHYCWSWQCVDSALAERVLNRYKDWQMATNYSCPQPLCSPDEFFIGTELHVLEEASVQMVAPEADDDGEVVESDVDATEVSLLEKDASAVDVTYRCEVTIRSDNYPNEMSFALSTARNKPICSYDGPSLRSRGLRENKRLTLICLCPKWEDIKVNCHDSYGDGWSTGYLEITQDPSAKNAAVPQRFCATWGQGKHRLETMSAQSHCKLHELRAATINIDKFTANPEMSHKNTMIAVSTAVQGVLQMAGSLVPFIPDVGKMVKATMELKNVVHAVRVGVASAGMTSAGVRSGAVTLNSIEGKAKMANVIKDVMDETIAEIYTDMKESQDILKECMDERLDQQAHVLTVEMAERDFSMRLHGMLIHAQNRLATAEEYVTEESQAVSFAATAVEEGLRGCYDVRELTELIDEHMLVRALNELLLVQELFTICTEFGRLVEFLSSWGDIVPFRGSFMTDKYMAESFLLYFRHLKYVTTQTTPDSVVIVHEMEFRIRNHLNTIKMKHQHALLNFEYPRRQPTLRFSERPTAGTQKAGDVVRILELGEKKTFSKTCRRCMMDKTGFDLREGEEERYWCWEEERDIETCLDMDGQFIDGPTEPSNVDACKRKVGGYGGGQTYKCYA